MLEGERQSNAPGGAAFCGRVEKTDGKIRASCFVAHEPEDVVPERLPRTRLFETRREAESWIIAAAEARGFRAVRWLASLD